MSESVTILLVEDQADQAMLVRDALSQDCDSVVLKIVSSGEEAIAYLSGEGNYSDRSNYPIPIIMLLDLSMPGIGGFGVLRWQREHPEIASNLHTVILTSMESSKDMEAAAALGARTYWVKSDYLLLRERIRMLLATVESEAG